MYPAAPRYAPSSQGAAIAPPVPRYAPPFQGERGVVDVTSPCLAKGRAEDDSKLGSADEVEIKATKTLDEVLQSKLKEAEETGALLDLSTD